MISDVVVALTVSSSCPTVLQPLSRLRSACHSRRDEALPSSIPASCRGRGRAADRDEDCKRASLSLAPRALARRLRARRRQRHRRAPDGAVVFGAAGTALLDREPPRRRHQHGHPGGPITTPPPPLPSSPPPRPRD